MKKVVHIYYLVMYFEEKKNKKARVNLAKIYFARMPITMLLIHIEYEH